MKPDVEYLHPVAAKYGVDDAQVVHVCRELVRNLEPAQISELADAYREIERREDSFAISHWLNTTPPSEQGRGEFRPMLMLFYLFEELAQQNVPPFNDGVVRLYPEPDPKLDWTKLPPDLSYLAGPAAKYGHYCNIFTVAERINRMTPEEKEELAVVARRVIEDDDGIREWQKKFDMLEHPEAERIHFLFGVIEQLGLWA